MKKNYCKAIAISAAPLGFTALESKFQFLTLQFWFTVTALTVFFLLQKVAVAASVSSVSDGASSSTAH